MVEGLALGISPLLPIALAIYAAVVAVALLLSRRRAVDVVIGYPPQRSSSESEGGGGSPPYGGENGSREKDPRYRFYRFRTGEEGSEQR